MQTKGVGCGFESRRLLLRNWAF